MPRIRVVSAAGVLALFLLSSCQRPARTAPVQPSPSATARTGSIALTPADLDMYLTVRNRALQRLEDSVAEVEAKGGDVVSSVEELGVAERRTAGGLGVDWQRYAAVREEVGRLMALQRRQEDARTLSLELSNARDDLTAQLRAARDPASRQFLEAQLKRLSGQLADLDRERQPTAEEVEQLKLLEHYRAQIAIQQGRQERLQRQIAELLEKNRVGGSAPVRVRASGGASRSTPGAPRE
ncbi:MAG: hypothetical protein ACM3O7_11615 [Acidobacteriota bacterium]